MELRPTSRPIGPRAPTSLDGAANGQPGSPTNRSPAVDIVESKSLPIWWWIGVLLILPAVGLLRNDSIPQGPTILAFAAGVAIVGWTSRMGRRPSDRALRRASLAGVVALHLHWLAAGGIMFPALMLPCWALLAAGASSPEPVDCQRSVCWTKGTILLALGIACTYSGLFARIHGRDQILDSIRMEEGAVSDADIALCRAAAERIPSDPTGWVTLALLHERRLDWNAKADYRQAAQSWERAIELEPRRYLHHRSLGRLHSRAARLGLDSAAGREAAEAFARMVECNPSSAAGRWEWAAALLAIGRTVEGRDQFAAACRLDDEMPHADKKLSVAQRRFAEAVANDAGQRP